MRVVDILHEFDFSFLRDAATLVDSRLRVLELAAQRSEDPDGQGICDKAEYITGFGFVACQTYIIACVSKSGLSKRKALEFGPFHSCGQSIVSLVNAWANYWKHGPEWGTPMTQQAQETLATISALGIDVCGSYPTTNALAALVRPNEPRLERLIPFLRQWRDSLQPPA